MKYAISYIVRFEGTLTQGPNKGRSYTFANSWGGVQFDHPDKARALIEKYRTLEPALSFKLLSRQFQDSRVVETEIPF